MGSLLDIWTIIKDVGTWLGWGRKPQPPEPAVADARGVLILGSGGVGKSTLGKILSGEYDLLFDLAGEYNESLFTETYLQGGPDGVAMIVPPGQPTRRAVTWDEMFQDLAGGKFRGVMLLGSYGYHNHTIGPNVSYKQHPLYVGQAQPRSKERFLKAFLDQRRAEEVDLLRQLAPHLTVAPGKVWFLTVVTKQDLWCDDQIDVEAFYRGGDYGRIVAGLLGTRGTARFRHDLALASLVIRKFATGTGEVLRPNTAGYDHHDHAQALRRLFEALDSLRQWELQP